MDLANFGEDPLGCFAWIGGSCNRTANDEILAARRHCPTSCGRTRLIIGSRGRRAASDARCDDEEVLAARAANRPDLLRRGDDAVETSGLGELRQ